MRAAASKSDKTNDFKLDWGSVTTTVAVISEKGGGCQLSMRSFGMPIKIDPRPRCRSDSDLRIILGRSAEG
jgi:hypothetical protein